MTVVVPRPLTSAGTEAIKLLAFVLMVADHADLALFGGALGAHAGIGRIVFPLFAVALAINLATVDPGHIARVVVPRMLAVGAIASLPYAYAVAAWPLNIMFTLAGAALGVAWWRSGRSVAAVLVLLATAVVGDYGTHGVLAVVLATWALRGGLGVVVATVAAAGVAAAYAGSPWPLLAVPVVLALRSLPGNMPRLKWLFYTGYPAHLAMLAAVKLVASA